jgi:hypothetical protein
MIRIAVWSLLAPVAFAASADKAPAPQVNHEGRTLPPLPKIDKPILFNTPEADKVLEAMQVFPKDNPWNEDISKLPVLPNSDKMIQRIGPDKRLAWNLDMGFVIVPPGEPKIDVKLTAYADESDKAPYPLPDCAPIEDWPLNGVALEKLQREGKGDRHVIVVDSHNGMLYEFYTGRRTDKGWEAACEATFDLKSNKLRPKGWTSSDAAGLPVFPAVVRYDECERGKVEHALRVTIRQTRREFIYPATHFASRITDADAPAMGQRFRLKASVDTSKFPKHAQAIAYGLKKYGMIVADNGGDWRISIAPDSRIQGLDALRQLKGGDFEVVQTTDQNEGPRAKWHGQAV